MYNTMNYQQPMMMNQAPMMPMQGGMIPQNQAYPYYGNMGMVYNQPIEPPKMTNPLDNIEKRIKSGAGRAIEITQEALDRAICTHRYGNKLHLNDTNNPDNPGEQICDICGAVFNLIENATPAQIHQVVRDCINTLHTIKVMYVNIPDNLCKQIFQIIAVLEQVDKLWGIAAEQFNKYQNPYQIADTQNMANNTFAIFNNMMGQNPMFQQPMMGQPMGMPMQPMQMQPQQPMMSQQGMPAIQPGPMGQPMNMQAQAMTAQAPGLTTNGFGATSAPVNVTPEAPVPTEAPKVTKQLQA